MFCVILFSKQKLKPRFYWIILLLIFLANTARKWRHPFICILLHCDVFVIRCYRLTDDYDKASKLSIFMSVVVPQFSLSFFLSLSLSLYTSLSFSLYIYICIYRDHLQWTMKQGKPWKLLVRALFYLIRLPCVVKRQYLRPRQK